MFQRFPRLRVLICHCGGALNRFMPTDPHLSQKDLRANVFYDTCAHDLVFLEAVIKQRGVESMCFGTEQPGLGAPCVPTMAGRPTIWSRSWPASRSCRMPIWACHRAPQPDPARARVEGVGVTSFQFDLYSEAVSRDPYPFYSRMRAEHPVLWCESTQAWALSRYDDVLAALLDPATFSSAKGNIVNDNPARAGKTLGTTDPPRHDQLRKLVNDALLAVPSVITKRRCGPWPNSSSSSLDTSRSTCAVLRSPARRARRCSVRSLAWTT